MSGWFVSGGGNQCVVPGSGGVISYRRAELEAAQALLGDAQRQVGEALGELHVAFWIAQSMFGVDAMQAQALAGRIAGASAQAASAQAGLAGLQGLVALAETRYEAVEAEIRDGVTTVSDRVDAWIFGYFLESAGPYPSLRMTEDLANYWPAYAGDLVVSVIGALLPVSRAATARGRVPRAQARKNRDVTGDDAGLLTDSLIEEHLGDSVPERVGHVAGWVAGLLGMTGPIRVVSIRGGAGWSRSGGAVAPERVDAARDADPPEILCGSMDQLLAHQEATEAGHGGPGEILVTSTRTPNGMVHTVSLPGTQLQEPEEGAGTNPADMAGIAEAAGTGSEHMTQAVLDALEAVGAREGDSLVLTGYSQGGMHAANMAASAEVGRRYAVKGLVTWGAPVGLVELPEDVRAVSFEHVHDAVPGADGSPNRATAAHVTIQSDRYAPGIRPGVDSDSALGNAHSFENYRYITQGASLIGEPVATAAFAGLAGIYAGATATQANRVTLRRERPTPSSGVRRGRGAGTSPAPEPSTSYPGPASLGERR